MTESAFPPRLSCDCHVHIVGPKSVFPLGAQRSYTPMDATADDLAAMLRRTGAERAVIVQPSIYGHDNGCLIHALDVLGDSARGVAVVGDDCPASESDRLHKAGVRGLRVNLISSGRADIADGNTGQGQAVVDLLEHGRGLITPCPPAKLHRMDAGRDGDRREGGRCVDCKNRLAVFLLTFHLVSM